MKRHVDEIAELVTLGRMRNALLMAKTMDAELRAAAERVMRLSIAGTPERLLTLIEVARDSGLATTAILDEIVRIRRKDLEQL